MSNKLTIVIPVHNEQDNLKWHHDQVSNFLVSNKVNFTLLYVDDGSTDDSLSILRTICANDPKADFISLSRNFGKEVATSAGIHHASGDAVVIMDADGQHPVEMVKEFVGYWKRGYEVVVGIRTVNTGEGFIKKYGSSLFYKTLRAIGGRDVTPGSTDFCLIDRTVVEQFKKLTERNRVTRDLISWLGFKRIEIPFQAKARHAGNASYSTKKLVSLAINGLVSHSTRPLKIVALLGLLISAISATAVIMLGVQKYLLGDPLDSLVTGSGILALFISFLVGVVLVCQGLLALYLESVYHETQNRPLFVIRERSK